MTAQYNKEATVEAAIETTDLAKIEEKTLAKTILERLLEGYTKRHILEELEISDALYTRLIKTTLQTHQPLPEDIDQQRDLAHQRYLKLLRRYQELADSSETTNQEIVIMREIRATIKDIGDIYSIKMPEKLEVDVTVNHKSDDIAKQIINALRPSQDLELEPIKEAEIVEEEPQEKDLGTTQLEALKADTETIE